MFRTLLSIAAASLALALSGAGSATASAPVSIDEGASSGAQTSIQIAGVLLPKRTKLVIDYRRTRLA